jgi:hypothetical protein
MAEQLGSARKKLAGRLRASQVSSAPRAKDDLVVALTTPTWTVQRSTDRDYVYGSFSRLAELYPLAFQAANALQYVVQCNLDTVGRRIARGFGFTASGRAVTPAFAAPTGAEAVFAYGRYPSGRDRVPVLWEHSFAPQLDSDHEEWSRHFLRECALPAQAATRVVVPTEASREWFVRLFPLEAEKVRVLPYYLPTLQAISTAALEAKQAEDVTRLLFVGKEARRKGLQALVDAWRLLPSRVRRHVSVRVVSAMLDGEVAIPAEWDLSKWVPSVTVEMRRAHALVFPTRREAYGLVLVEGLSAGCMALTTSALSQRSIVGDQAGLFVDPRRPQELADAITLLVEDRARRNQAMADAVLKFTQDYRPELVGQRYAELLWETAGRTSPVPVRMQQQPATSR